MESGDINEGCDWATGLAIDNNSDAFVWDCDGLGIGLNRQVNQAFEGKHTLISQYRGSGHVDDPDALFQPADRVSIQDQKTNKEALKNCRAQYYFKLRNRIYRTYRAVEHGEYHDPDTLISFSSGITCLRKLRAELSRLPIKHNNNGLFELYTKKEMLDRFKIESPNLADSVKMSLRVPKNIQLGSAKRPPSIRPIGWGQRDVSKHKYRSLRVVG